MGFFADSSSSLALSGEFHRLSGSKAATGNRLVRTSTAASPRELCRRWDVPLIQGAGVSATTDYAFFVPETFGLSGPDIVGRVYNEKGDLVQTVSLPIPPGVKAFERSSPGGAGGGHLLEAAIAAVGRLVGRNKATLPAFLYCRPRAIRTGGLP